MKRWLLRICLFLLLGALVNVAVAWGINLRQGSDYSIYSRSWGAKTPASADDATWLRSIGWSKPQDTECLRYSLDTCHVSALGFRQQTFHDNVEPLCPGRHAHYDGPFAAKVAVGWPLPALRDEVRDMRVGGAIAVAGFDHALGATLGGDAGYSVPFRPIWPGFAINTVFYAGVLWLLFAAPFALRRGRRIKRGLCARCGYPWGTGGVCSECGSTLVGKTPVHGALPPATPGPVPYSDRERNA